MNEVAETGKYPKELKYGILTPLQKPGKKQGPCTNLRPIILLSMLRKILAICLLERTVDRIVSNLPNSQSAYQKRRSTTEQIFTLKLLIEQAIGSQEYTLWILLMDMSKAFDTVKRDILIEDLRTIMERDELHLCKILIEDVQLSVRVGKSTSQPFITQQGIAQGDCLSAIFFILYLSKAMNYHPHLQDHSYAIRTDLQKETPSHLQDHTYDISESKINALYKEALEIAVQYADDCGYAIISQTNELMKYRAATIPPSLKRRNLNCNEEKNEDYEVKNKGDDRWTACKYLGSLLDTEKDITRRKILALDAMKTMNNIWRSRISRNIKCRIFNACIAPIFLANSELWTVNGRIDKKIDCFQRRLLRQALNIRYPKKISNENLKEITNFKEWSIHISIQRLRWLGHAFRLPENSPAKQALLEIENTPKRCRGRPKTKWIDTVEKQLEKLNVTFQEAKYIATNRKKWNQIINRWCKMTAEC